MKVYLKDGSVREYDKPVRVIDVARDIGQGLARCACAGEIDGKPVDLRTEVPDGSTVNILTFEDDYGRDAFRHSASHLLAQAVKRLYPNAKLAIGPPIDNGFYYDIDREEPFTPEDLAALEKEMQRIVKENIPIERFVCSREEALDRVKKEGENYKAELIENLPDDAEISFYTQGEFCDLCAGPHLMETGQLKAFKLMSLAGAYWRGSEDNKMLTRIYGTIFPSKKELKAHLERLEEAKRRDHRKIGRDMELFMMNDDGPGFPFFLTKGVTLKNTLIDYWREIHLRENYQEIQTPMILNQRLWETSGHWAHYRENMYTTTIDDETYVIKPMNCPGAMLVYNSKPHSYRDLPYRLAELGTVHRHEKSGVLHGLMRVRCFTQDDAHIFMTHDQMIDEIKRIVRLIDEVYLLFGFKYHVELSTRPESSMGSDEDWEHAINGLKQALEEMELNYVVNEGDGAFYGPKIDFHLEDSLGRTWQCGTIQLDFQLPERFDSEYIGADGERHRPIVIHRVAFGSIERFIGILIEHFAGKFPTWLAPEQIRILPVSDKFYEYGETIKKQLVAAGFRAEFDDRDEKLGYKIRAAQKDHIPYMLVVGADEEESGTISVRNRDKRAQTTITVDDFIQAVDKEIIDRQIELIDFSDGQSES